MYLLSPVLILLSPVLKCTGTSTGPGIQCTGRHTVADDATATATATDSLDDDDDLMEERIGALFRFLLANESSRHVWPGLKFIGCPMGCDDDDDVENCCFTRVPLVFQLAIHTTVCHHSSFNLSCRTPRRVSSMKRIVRMMITGTITARQVGLPVELGGYLWGIGGN